MTRIFRRIQSLFDAWQSAIAVREAVEAGRVPAASDLRRLNIEPASFRDIRLY